MKLQNELGEDQKDYQAKMKKLDESWESARKKVWETDAKLDTEKDPAKIADLKKELATAQKEQQKFGTKKIELQNDYLAKQGPFGMDSTQAKIFEKNRQLLEHIADDGLKQGCFEDYQNYVNGMQMKYRLKIEGLKKELQKCNGKTTNVTGVSEDPLKKHEESTRKLMLEETVNSKGAK